MVSIFSSKYRQERDKHTSQYGELYLHLFDINQVLSKFYIQAQFNINHPSYVGDLVYSTCTDLIIQLEMYVNIDTFVSDN